MYFERKAPLAHRACFSVGVPVRIIFSIMQKQYSLLQLEIDFPVQLIITELTQTRRRGFKRHLFNKEICCRHLVRGLFSPIN